MRKIIFDIETRNEFSEVGSADPTKLDIAVVGIYDSETDAYTTYLVEDLPKLWPILEHADMLIGFYSDNFDLPLLNKNYPGDLLKLKSFDLLKEIRRQNGRGASLDKFAAGTLGKKKGGDGLEAIKWWKQGEIEKIKEYCLDDVRITKELYDYAREHGKLIFKEGTQLKEIPLETKDWEAPSENKLTFSLPF